jgi:hypothetical protein
MKKEQEDFLKLFRLPGLLTDDQFSYLTGFLEHEVPIVSKPGLFPPLALKELAGCSKRMWSSAEVLRLLEDSEVMERCRKAIVTHWKNKHKRTEELKTKKKGNQNPSPSES